MKETTQLRKSFLGGYRREDVQEYFDELYEDAEKKYKELADEHDRLAQENLLLRRWIGDDQESVDGFSVLDLNSQAAFDLPEGVYQFDPQSHKVLDLTSVSEPVEFKAAAAGYSFAQAEAPKVTETGSAKLTVVPSKSVEVKTKEAPRAEAVKDVGVPVKAEVKVEPKTVTQIESLIDVQSEALAGHGAENRALAETELQPESAKLAKVAVESKPQLDYQQKRAAEKIRQPKRYYVKGRTKTEAVETANTVAQDRHVAATTANQPNAQDFQTQQILAQQMHYQQSNQQPNQHNPYYPNYQTPYQTQGFQSPQFFQAPPAFYPSTPYPAQPMYQAAAPDANLLARVEKLEAELTQTKAQLNFANGLLKDLYH